MVTVLSFMNLKYENVKMRQYLLNIFKWLRDNANPSFNKLCTARVNKALMTSSNKTKPTAHDVNQINGQQYKDICDLSKISPAFKSSWYFAFMQYINNSSTSLSIPTGKFQNLADMLSSTTKPLQSHLENKQRMTQWTLDDQLIVGRHWLKVRGSQWRK